MKIIKELFVEINGALLPVTVTLDAPDELLHAHCVDARTLLTAAATCSDTLIRSRHHANRNVHILARPDSIAAALITERQARNKAQHVIRKPVEAEPRLRLVA